MTKDEMIAALKDFPGDYEIYIGVLTSEGDDYVPVTAVGKGEGGECMIWLTQT